MPMGRDLTLYPKKATKEQLRGYLKNLGFEKCGHLWDWPKGTLNYYWFDTHEFKSIDGVSADIYPASKEEIDITGNEWALHLRNLACSSWHDVYMLNQTLRGARKAFGGEIRGDYGKNRYAPLWEDKSTPISRGLSGIYQHVKQKICAVEYAIPDPLFPHPPLTGRKIDELIEYNKKQDPSRVIYNGLVPFAISMFEFFFSQAFQLLIAYDNFALNKRDSFKEKIDFKTVIDIQNNKTSIENLISKKYSFQNIDDLNKAFKEWLDIDVRSILYRKKKIGKNVDFLVEHISNVIDMRHGIIHHFDLDYDLTKESFVSILSSIQMAIDEFVFFVQNKYKIEVDKR
jgi:hypothetical protein